MILVTNFFLPTRAVFAASKFAAGRLTSLAQGAAGIAGSEIAWCTTGLRHETREAAGKTRANTNSAEVGQRRLPPGNF
jgi:hypothetical protein